MNTNGEENFVYTCSVKSPPVNLLEKAIDFVETSKLSVSVPKYWSPKGVLLTVGFLDSPSSELRDRILLHMNAWSKTANVKFVETQSDPQVRITRSRGYGHWSYLGTDILKISPDQPTMNLDSFTTDTPDSEFYRVIRHETGHTLGFPHEHMRKEIIKRIDIDKAIKHFEETEGWSTEQIFQNILIPLEDNSIMGTASADVESIMCYSLPGKITVDGNPITGGVDMSEQDYEFISKIYPK